MNQLKMKFYQFAYTDKNPVFRLFMKHEMPQELYGSNYGIIMKDKTLPVLIYPGKEGVIFDIHGGGYTYGDYRDEDHFCKYLHDKTGMTIVSCNYSLSGTAKFPTQIEQVYTTIKAILSDSQINTEKIYLVGHSAGANCAAAQVLLAGQRQEFRIDKVVLNYPWLDLACNPGTRPKVKGNNMSSGMLQMFRYMYFANMKDSRLPLASPLLADMRQLECFPGTYIMTCAQDALRIDGVRFCERLKLAGIKVHFHEVNAHHGFIEEGMRGCFQKINSKTELAKEEINKMIDWYQED